MLKSRLNVKANKRINIQKVKSTNLNGKRMNQKQSVLFWIFWISKRTHLRSKVMVVQLSVERECLYTSNLTQFQHILPPLSRACYVCWVGWVHVWFGVRVSVHVWFGVCVPVCVSVVGLCDRGRRSNWICINNFKGRVAECGTSPGVIWGFWLQVHNITISSNLWYKKQFLDVKKIATTIWDFFYFFLSIMSEPCFNVQLQVCRDGSGSLLASSLTIFQKQLQKNGSRVWFVPRVSHMILLFHAISEKQFLYCLISFFLFLLYWNFFRVMKIAIAVSDLLYFLLIIFKLCFNVQFQVYRDGSASLLASSLTRFTKYSFSSTKFLCV